MKTIIIYAYYNSAELLIEFLHNYYNPEKADLLVLYNKKFVITDLLLEKLQAIKNITIKCSNNSQNAYETWLYGLTSLELKYDFYYFFKNGKPNRSYSKINGVINCSTSIKGTTHSDFFFFPREYNWLDVFNQKLLQECGCIVPMIHLRTARGKLRGLVEKSAGQYIDKKNQYILVPITSYIGLSSINIDEFMKICERKEKKQYIVGMYMLERSAFIDMYNIDIPNHKIDDITSMVELIRKSEFISNGNIFFPLS